MNTLKRMTVVLPVLTFVIFLGFWSSATAERFPETIPLPDAFQPEGITLGNGHTAYVGSLADGSIYEVDLRTGEGSVLVTGTPGSLMAVGLDFDKRSSYLFVAGGITGYGLVYDTKTGELVAPLGLGAPWMSWINDVVVTRDAAYFTDSFAPQIFKVSLTSEGAPTGVVIPLPLTGDWDNAFPSTPEEIVINANGIVATPNGRRLIVVNYALGRLFNVDPDTGSASEINLGGFTVPSGDGLVLRGKTLYVVQNFANAIAVFTLSPDYSSATFNGYLTDHEHLRIPSTADSFGPWIYAVNARFDVCFPLEYCPPDTDFDIVRVDQ